MLLNRSIALVCSLQRQSIPLNWHKQASVTGFPAMNICNFCNWTQNVNAIGGGSKDYALYEAHTYCIDILKYTTHRNKDFVSSITYGGNNVVN